MIGKYAFSTLPETLPVVSSTAKIQKLRCMQIFNQTKNTIVATHAIVANTSKARRVGLLKHESLQHGEGMWICPCESVHTVGMKFPIDIIYLDRKHRIKKLKQRVPAWRISFCLTAHSVLELPAGTIAFTRTQVHDQLLVRDSNDEI